MKIDNILKSSGISLAKQASGALQNEAQKQLSGAVEDFVRGKLKIPTSSAAGVALRPEQQPKSSSWDATSYAASLAGGTPARPKLKFLFKVQFFFSPQLRDIAPWLDRSDFTFMIKQVDRPKVDFEYEDDVNMYNFRTKALKKVKHRELTITFLDDVGNNVFDFFRILLMVYSPITRASMQRDGNVNAKPDPEGWQKGNGMAFSDFNNFPGGGDIAHRAVFNANAGNAIDIIRVKQIFIDPTTTPGSKDNAVKAVFYDYVNPRLVSFDLDDLSHESSDPNLLTMQFDYDWMEMTKHDKLLVTGDGGPPLNFPVAGLVGQQGVTGSGAPTDILQGNSTAAPAARAQAASAGNSAGRANPFANILGGVAGKAAQQLTSSLVNKAVQQIGGNGIMGSILRQAAGSAVSGLSSAAGGLVQSAVADQAAGLFSKVNQATARPMSGILSDRTGQTTPAVSTQSSSNFYSPQNPGLDPASGPGGP